MRRLSTHSGSWLIRFKSCPTHHKNLDKLLNCSSVQWWLLQYYLIKGVKTYNRLTWSCSSWIRRGRARGLLTWHCPHQLSPLRESVQQMRALQISLRQALTALPVVSLIRKLNRWVKSLPMATWLVNGKQGIGSSFPKSQIECSFHWLHQLQSWC